MVKRYALYGVLVLTVLLTAGLKAEAAPISGGVPDTGIKERTTRDGASGIHFIDLESPISGAGWITSWSIYAQKHVLDPWLEDNGPRDVSMMIFRKTVSGYLVVGRSPMETISIWDHKYTFTDLGAGIPVQAGDYLGWYYPFQGAEYPGNPPLIPGGVIAFDWLSGYDVSWHTPWGSGQGPQLGVGDTVAHAWFNGYDGGRVYSINVSGSTVPIPLPASLPLLGAGVLGLLGLKRFRNV